MRRLGVQLVLQSRAGAVVPIAITSDVTTVEYVARRILDRMRRRRFDDEVLDLINKDEERRLTELLRGEDVGIASEGMEDR